MLSRLSLHEPRTVSIIVICGFACQRPVDLKGRTIIIPARLVAEWLVRQMAVAEGCGHGRHEDRIDRIRCRELAVIESHEADAATGRRKSALLSKKRTRSSCLWDSTLRAPLPRRCDYARTDLIQNDPDLVQRFLNGFFASSSAS